MSALGSRADITFCGANVTDLKRTKGRNVLASGRAEKPKQQEPLEICDRDNNQNVRDQKQNKSRNRPNEDTDWKVEKRSLLIKSITKDSPDADCRADEPATYWINARDQN
jgi:hypothetical protein